MFWHYLFFFLVGIAGAKLGDMVVEPLHLNEGKPVFWGFISFIVSVVILSVFFMFKYQYDLVLELAR